jgi:hypothetical protein
LYRPDATKDEQIKQGKQEDVYNHIVNAFKDFSGSTYNKETNQWYNQTKQWNLPYTAKKDGTNWIMDVRTSYVYANGKMTEDGEGGSSIQRFNLSLLLVSWERLIFDSGVNTRF